MASEKPSKGQAWFCTTGLPSDIVVEVDDMTFHLHKFPLMSKSRKLHLLIAQQETDPRGQSSGRRRELGEEAEEDDDEEIEEVLCRITFRDFPGGSDTFELAAKFCYGVKIDVTASNVALLRCAGEFLEMTEDYSEDNLVAKTEKFFAQFVIKSLRDSVRALKSCEGVIDLAESLEIPQRCIEAVVSRASVADPSMFGWPVNEGAGQELDSVSQLIWNGIDGGNRRKGLNRGSNPDSWLEDMSLLSLHMFKLLISAMKAGELSSEIIEICLMQYAKKYIPSTSRSSRKPAGTAVSGSSSTSSVPSEREQRELLETITSYLPDGKPDRSSIGIRFLFGLLRTANILNASENCRAVLERRIGARLEQATLDDLLIPSYSYLNETLYDVDCVERILSHFLESVERRDEGAGAIVDISERSPTWMLVGKLIDGYLSEIASDANLKPDRFYKLAMSLPEHARIFDDGLYRAVDVYLKSHPWLSEADREKICGVMDFQKLTLEACTHAAQNERLPLRAVVQVLFFEQLQLRHAIAGTLLATEGMPHEPGRPSASQALDDDEDGIAERAEEEEEVAGAASMALAVVPGQGTTWRAAARENQVLRLDMDSMRSRVHQLERECSTMKRVIEKIDKEGGGGWKNSITRKFGCKFKTQVCDSHEPTVVEARRGRNNRGSART